MYESLILIVILLPILAGGLSLAIPFKKSSHQTIALEAVIIINSLLVAYLLFYQKDTIVTAIHFTGDLSIAFMIDGLGSVFATLVATLWPFATLYAIEYMRHEKHRNIFFAFYTATYGVTLGIAFSANLITMYLWYEVLTLVTVPLIMHTLKREAILASRKYLYYSLGGAAFAFIGVMFFIAYGQTANFTYGGVLERFTFDEPIINSLLLVYLITFLGFGVKAAVLPVNSWLPDAGVAPTPVTALLHAVAVVKSGAFAIMRITYYCYGATFLKETWVQTVVLLIVIATIIYGCSMALKETHIKRRLAYSTISNLSYILFGIVIMTPLGLAGALLHMLAHAVVKITAFFCAGSIMHQTGKTYVHELNGLGKKMPIVCGVFTVAACALMGVPFLPIFISKWNLAKAAVASENIIAYFGIVALLISALLTAIYMMSIVARFFFPNEGDLIEVEGAKDPNWYMLVPLGAFVILMISYGVNIQFIIEYVTQVALGLK
ncbi:MAG: proton-conducting transporter membrane subunit [Eubacteriales bacterium]